MGTVSKPLSGVAALAARLRQVITLRVSENPKKPGSAARERFALYRSGMTVEQALKAGVLPIDLRWDSDPRRQFITIGAPKAARPKPEKPEPSATPSATPSAS